IRREGRRSSWHVNCRLRKYIDETTTPRKKQRRLMPRQLTAAAVVVYLHRLVFGEENDILLDLVYNGRGGERGRGGGGGDDEIALPLSLLDDLLNAVDHPPHWVLLHTRSILKATVFRL